MFMFFGRKCPIRVAAIDSPIFKKGQDYVEMCHFMPSVGSKYPLNNFNVG